MTLVLSLLLACATPEAPAPIPTEVGAPAPAAEHATAAHDHPAPHGGVVQVLGETHVEALLMPDGILFYLTDGKEGTLPVEGYTGTVVVKGPDGVVTVPLTPMGDHLHAAAKLAQGQPASAVLTLTRDGKAESGMFETKSVGMEAHAHTSMHGGDVIMRGNWHIEYVPVDGEYRVWLTDELRVAVTEGVTASVKDGDREIPLVLDPGTKMLSAKAEGAGTRPVTIQVKVGETSFTADVPAKTGEAGHGEGAHGAPGHTHQ